MIEKYKVKIGDQSLTIEVEKVGSDDPVITNPPQPSTGFKVGANSFPWVPLRLFESIGMKWVRCYVASGWIWRPNGLFVQPMFQAETQETHGLDDYLQRAKEKGINPLLCIHQTPEWFRNTGRGDGNNDFAPIKAGASRTDPASYKEYAEFLFQVAARYGRVKLPDNVLEVDTTPRWSGDILNEKKSGLDLLTYLEIWNEPDKWWKKGTEAYFEPEETAAMMSACYDGHEGKLGGGVGIKQADPSMKVIMPGITDTNLPYMQKMDAWFKTNRKDRVWPCDTLNVHHYANRGNKKDQYPAQWVDEGACTPVYDSNFPAIRDIVDFAAGMGKKVWQTEFGADKIGPSMMLAKGIAESNEQFQSKIIIQAVKDYKSAGVDAVFVFNSSDENNGADGGQFETCGLWSSEATGYRPFVSANDLRAYLAAPAKDARLPQMLVMKASEFKRPIKK